MENHLDNLELRSEEVQEILTKVPHWMIRWGNVLFLVLILLLLALSWFIKYPDIIAAEAMITTQIPPEKEFAQTSGKIEAILVEDNQMISSDTPLAIIENSANFEDVLLLKKAIDTVKLDKTTFNFPVEKLPVLFLGDIEAQFAIFENNYNLYTLNKQFQPINKQLDADRTSVIELNRQLANLKSQRKNNKLELELSKERLKKQETLFNKGVISRQEYENEKIAFSKAERNYKSFEASISQTKNALSNATSATKGTEINRIKEEITLLKSVLQSFNQLKIAIKEWERTYVLKSNINGRVSFLNYWNANQNVNAGDLIFTVIPSQNSSFIAKLKTPSQNSGKIKIGQIVNISLDNYPKSEFGVLNGEVRKISSIPDEEGLYLVDVMLPQKLVTSYKQQIEFKQEMRGSAEIITKDLRLIERFFYQFRELLDR